MKKIFFIILLFPIISRAQDNGIRFETGLSWQQIKEKAKAENKPVFMDCFATWCGPCKFMDQTVFSQKTVGDFMNKNFICIKVQMDQTDHDLQSIKDWYQTAAQIKNDNNIHSYPTYLFFSPEAKTVHWFKGATGSRDFLKASADALLPEKQNFSLLTNWPRHLTDSTYLQHAFFAAKESMDEENERAIASAYVDCLGYLKQPLSKKHIETLRNLIFSEKDKAFQFFLQHAAEINKITHSDDYTESTLCWIIFIEEVEPQLATGKPSYDWKVISEKIQRKYPELDKTQFFNHLTTDGIERRLKEDITAKENEKTLNSVDWQQMNTQFKHKYRNYDDAERVLFSQRAQYFYNMGLWDLSAAAAISLIEKYRFSNKYTDRDINNFCWYMILLHSGDKKTLESATKYMETVVKPYLNDGILKQDIGRADAGLVYTYLDTYSNLLYKAGHAKEALNFEKQIVASAEKLRISKKGFEESLDKIQRNEPTWLDNTPTSANR